MQLNIILLRVNNFDIKQKKPWNICQIICHQCLIRSGKIKANKTQQILVKAQVFFVKTEPQHTRFFYKQHFYKQHQAEIGKKNKQKLSSTLRLIFCYLKSIGFLHSRYHPNIIGDIIKYEQKKSTSV